MTRTRRPAALALVTALLAIAGCSGGAVEIGAARAVESPAPPGSRTPNLAVGLDGTLYLSWIEPRDEGHALCFSSFGGDGWSPPRTIVEGRDWFVNWADFPSMAALEDGTLAAHWLVRSGDAPYAYDVYLSVSTDRGVTWSEPLRPHRDDTATEHGFVSLVPNRDGAFDVIWLDGRYTADTPRGAMTLRHATLLPNGELRNEAQVDDSVCDCCSTDALRTGDGALLTAYRDRTAAEIRDISVARLETSTWSDPRTVNADGWDIPACPVNGPALAARGDRVAVAWFTGANDAPLVRVAFSRDAGRAFDTPVRVDEGDPLGRVDLVLLDDGSALVSWLEHVEGEARVMVRQVAASGALAATPVATTSEARSSGFPRMERLGNDVVFAWTEDDEPSRIATAVLSVR